MKECLKDKLLELISEENGRLSHTKLWNNISSFSIILYFLYSIYNKTVDNELVLIVGGLFIGNRVGSGFRQKLVDKDK